MAQNLPTFWCLNSRKTSSMNNVAIRTTVKPDDASTEKNSKQRKAFDEQGMFDKSQSPPSLFWLAGHDIARSVFEKSTQTPREGFWNNPEWMLFKSHLQGSTAPRLLDDVYNQHFRPCEDNCIVELGEACPSCNKLKEKAFLVEHNTLLMQWLFNQTITPNPSNETLLFLSETPPILSLDKIVFGNVSSPELLQPCLENQTHITKLEFDDFSSWPVFFQTGPDPKRWTEFSFTNLGNHFNPTSSELFDQLLAFLTEAKNLQYFSWQDCISEDQTDRLWSVLALLPNLKKLELSSLDLGHPADATPLEPVTHFIMSEHTVAEAFDFDRLLPSLVDFHWKGMDNHGPMNPGVLSKVTRLSEASPHDENGPFEVLSQMPRAKIVDMRIGYPSFNLQPFELENLTNLKMETGNKWTMDELKAAFAFFPNLTDLSLDIIDLADDFSEQEFIFFLENNRSKFAKLCNLTLWFRKAPATMTAKTVIAIVRNSNLNELNCLINLPPFTLQDQEDLRQVLREKKLDVAPIFATRRKENRFLFAQYYDLIECFEGKHLTKGRLIHPID